MKRVTIYLGDEFVERLKADATRRGVSVSALIRDALPLPYRRIRRRTGDLPFIGIGSSKGPNRNIATRTAELERESRRERVSISEIARKAIEARLHPFPIVDGKRQISFIGMGNSGLTDLSERIDEILAEEWTRENLIDRNL